MNSKIYVGYIEHNRYHPVDHQLRYPLYVYAFDLDELIQMDGRFPFFGYNRLRPTSIYDADYLQPGPVGIKHKLAEVFANKGIVEKIDSVVMITSARYLNDCVRKWLHLHLTKSIRVLFADRIKRRDRTR